jgi:hypothetical protein
MTHIDFKKYGWSEPDMSYWTAARIISYLVNASLRADPTRKFLYCWEEAGLQWIAENLKEEDFINAWTADLVQEWVERMK